MSWCPAEGTTQVKLDSALDKLLGQLGIYATWLSLIAYLQKQFFFYTTIFSVITHFLIE